MYSINEHGGKFIDHNYRREIDITLDVVSQAYLAKIKAEGLSYTKPSLFSFSKEFILRLSTNRRFSFPFSSAWAFGHVIQMSGSAGQPGANLPGNFLEPELRLLCRVRQRRKYCSNVEAPDLRSFWVLVSQTVLRICSGGSLLNVSYR